MFDVSRKSSSKSSFLIEMLGTGIIVIISATFKSYFGENTNTSPLFGALERVVIFWSSLCLDTNLFHGFSGFVNQTPKKAILFIASKS